MKFFCGVVVSTGGFEFILKRAEKKPPSIYRDSDVPGFFFLSPGKAFVFRARRRFEFSSVPDVLRVCYEAEICLSVVKAIMI